MIADKRRIFIFAAISAAVVYVCIAMATDASRLKSALAQLGGVGCLMILLLSAANYAIRFFRWQYYLKKLGRKLPLGLHLTYYLAGFAFTASPGKAGEAVRSVYLQGHGVRYSESIAALFTERLLDLCAVVLLASLIAVDHAAYRPLLVGGLIAVLAAMGAVSQPALPRWLDLHAPSRAGRMPKALHALAGLLRSSGTLLNFRTLALGLVTGVMAWGAEGAGFFIICRTLDIPIGLGPAEGIYAVAILAGTVVFFLPAGIGGMEVVMTALLVERGATLRTAIIATLICRLATLWFAVMLGIVAALSIEVSQSTRRKALP